MSRFYASIQGNRGRATRQGTKDSGISGHIRGWDVGVHIQCSVNVHGEDEIRVNLTGGSRDSLGFKLLGVFTPADLQ